MLDVRCSMFFRLFIDLTGWFSHRWQRRPTPAQSGGTGLRFLIQQFQLHFYLKRLSAFRGRTDVYQTVYIGNGDDSIAGLPG